MADLSAIQRRAGELATQRDKLDSLDLPSLARLAETTYSEVEKTIGEGTSAPWYYSLVPLAYLGTGWAEEYRYKAAIDKLKYAKGWLDNAKSAKTEAMQRIGYKQSFSDSAYALQLYAEEANKGSTPSRLIEQAKETVDKEIGDIRQKAFIGLVIAGFFVWVTSYADKKQ